MRKESSKLRFRDRWKRRIVGNSRVDIATGEVTAFLVASCSPGVGSGRQTGLRKTVDDPLDILLSLER